MATFAGLAGAPLAALKQQASGIDVVVRTLHAALLTRATTVAETCSCCWLIRDRRRMAVAIVLARSDLRLLCDLERVIDFDSEIPHCAFEFRVAE